MNESIEVKGARAHNLKNISVSIPRDRITVITGPSGSGKSSLAFDTIFAEGQRRYVESLSVYARQFIEQLSKPELDSISGLSPTISIEQRTTSYNPRSTVGTITEIYDYLRLLFSRIANPICLKCSKPIKSQNPGQIVDQILALPSGTKIALLAPIIRGRKGEHLNELDSLRQQGFVRVKLDGEVRDLSTPILMDKSKRHDLSVYVDRMIIKPEQTDTLDRISESVELALKLGSGTLVLENSSKNPPEEILFSQKFACPGCNMSYPEPEPRLFSFNSPVGACPKCDGLGVEGSDDEEEEQEEDEEELNLSLFEPTKVCPECKGARLRKEALAFKIADRSITDLTNEPIDALEKFFKTIKFSTRELKIASRVLKEIQERLGFLNQVGVPYLSLSRSATTLSGGEAQRIRLATQIGSALVDVIYVLDEPSIGLHPRDHRKLLELLTRLRDLGNTVVIVEHDRETIETSDYVIDLGPGAGVHGGEVVAAGTVSELKKNKKSLTGDYLSGRKNIDIESSVKSTSTSVREKLSLVGVRTNNLQNVNVDFPLGKFICVTGVSGSGKSSLVLETLYPLAMKLLYKSSVGTLALDSYSGFEKIDKVVDIDQKPIGKTPRSNPATFTGLFSIIRDLYAQLPAAQVRGFKPGKFSFNVKEGQCEKCEGAGVIRVVMHFLPDVFVPCEVCEGSRYRFDALEVRYKTKSIADVLKMTVAEAYEFFSNVPSLTQKLKVLNDVGLSYITLGQPASTLSGGEAQRIKLAKELSRKSTGKTLYILDEPSTGLHFDDVRQLLLILKQLVEQGNTVVVIEHSLDFIKTADYIIDVGPEGGKKGGQIIASGPPETIALQSKSYTGKFLKETFGIT